MRLTTATTAAVAVALAIAAPAAWATPGPNPDVASPSSNAEPGTTTTHAIAAKRAPAAMYSRPDKSLITVSSATTTTHASAAKRMPAAVYSRPDKSLVVIGTAATFRGGFAKMSSAPRVPSNTAPTPADLIAAQRAAANPSASLDRFALINVHKIPPATTSGNSNPEQFHFGDAAIGAGVTAGLVLLGIAGLLAARRRRQPLHT